MCQSTSLKDTHDIYEARLLNFDFNMCVCVDQSQNASQQLFRSVGVDITPMSAWITIKDEHV